MLNAILEELLAELKERLPAAGFTSVNMMGILRIGMIFIKMDGRNTDPVTMFMNLEESGAVFDDGHRVPYEDPDMVDKVVAHFAAPVGETGTVGGMVKVTGPQPTKIPLWRAGSSPAGRIKGVPGEAVQQHPGLKLASGA